MIPLLRAALDASNKLLSENTHNYILVLVAWTWAGAVGIVLLWPEPSRLAIAKDCGTTLIGILGVVGGVHAAKSIKGVEGH